MFIDQTQRINEREKKINMIADYWKY